MVWVAVAVLVLVLVAVAVLVLVLVAVAVLVAVLVGVEVLVEVGVQVGVAVDVFVCVMIGSADPFFNTMGKKTKFRAFPAKPVELMRKEMRKMNIPNPQMILPLFFFMLFPLSFASKSKKQK